MLDESERVDADAAADERFMRRALDLALLGAGYVNPNPLVGAVIVRDGRIIGEGWHTKFGCLHAEREALANCVRRGEDPRGATVYVTLEPCCHTGKTPPCTDALIEAGVARVVVGVPDANPLVAGRGCRMLREAGIVVDEGVLLDACLSINEAFFHYISTKRPFVIAKFAMTLDGRVARRRGEPCRITGEAAHARVHEDRQRYAAVLVGVGTVLADDPLLTCRRGGVELTEASPLRVVCDTHLRCPLDARLVATARRVPTLIATCAPEAAHAPYREAGCTVVQLPVDECGHVSLDALMDELGARGIDSVIVEGGPAVHAAAFRAGIVNRVQAYIAPTIFGSPGAPCAVEGGAEEGADALAAVNLSVPRITRLGADVLLEYDVLEAQDADASTVAGAQGEER